MPEQPRRPGRRPRRIALLAVAGLLAALPACSTESEMADTPDAGEPAADQRPHVLVVVVDDLGWGDVSTGLTNRGHGNDFYETPAIDALAEAGTSFDSAYAAPTCSPSRTALLSGEYAPRADNNVFMVGGIDRGEPGAELTGPRQGRPDGRLVLPVDAVTVAETVRDAGYATGYAGKFHVTRFAQPIVEQHGFDENFGGSQAGAPGSYFAQDGEFDRTIYETLDPWAGDYTQDYVDTQVKPYSRDADAGAIDDLVGTPKHVTDALGDATIDFIDRHADQPTFTVLGQYGVHTPVEDEEARGDLLAKYEAKEPGSSPSVPAYAALLEGVDQSIARVVDHLETTPDPRSPGDVLADNTLVLVTSDNGGRTDVGADNGPLRGQKGELDEGGVRVPFVVWSGNPDLVQRGAVNSSVVNLLDVYPTVAQLADAEVPASVELDGTSLVDALATGATVDAPYFVHLPGYLQEETRDQVPETSMRFGRWKLRYTYTDRRFRLYDLDADLGERQDVSGRQRVRVGDLGERMLRWLDAVDAPLARLDRSRAPLGFVVQGRTYADGRVRTYRTPTFVTVRPGDEVPFVLPAR